MEKKKRLNILDIDTFSKKNIITTTPKDTKNLGEQFASILKNGDIVFLNGSLGSGKTTFVQGVIKAFGIKGFARSPSFILVNEYNINCNLKLFHLDLYRLEPTDIWNIGIEEYIYSNNIALIEWSNRLTECKNDNSWDIKIEYFKSKRIIKIEKKR
ncbi:MAG: tRNA (adenosine(37)-N6)-threonylcarbamoyltransferase complex ATPase subunit type 1 TsaE [Endomicrobium sp.]|jgi:tRNA threonylcarbamoyladenosine biosynthesis protein TsaE|nr:tRNA (adenosine(37)-N6)-threonylcarbamoyltransferase complex ATPase subunit type 1 TsaE [Endomicrobium sp.]